MISLIHVHTDAVAVGQRDQLDTPQAVTAKKALEIIETIIEEYENLPKDRLGKRITSTPGSRSFPAS